jgi:Ca2+:H+ antiporter
MLIGYVTLAITVLPGVGSAIHPTGAVLDILVFLWLFATVLVQSVAVMHRADHLATLLGEPLGTLLLTLSAVAIEVSLIIALLLNGEDNPTIARDTTYAVLMVVLNGLLGLALVVGALRHRRQLFNTEGAQSFLSLLMPLSVISLVLPNYTASAPGGTLTPVQAMLFAVVMLAIYAIFLLVQTRTHPRFFAEPAEAEADTATDGPLSRRSIATAAALLVVALVPVPLLADELAATIESGIGVIEIPEAVAGILVASLVLAPEGMSAIAAARRNAMQRAINILFGSALSTVAVTVPTVIVFSLLSGHDLVLGLEPESVLILVLSLGLAVVTFGRGQTDVLKGYVHLLVFAVFLLLAFVP